MSKKVALCFFCKTPEPRADIRAKAVLCAKCVARLAASPESIGKFPKTAAPKTPKAKRESKKVVTKTKVVAKKATKRSVKATPKVKTTATGGWGRGWHLKKHFVAPDGVTYSFGQPVEN